MGMQKIMGLLGAEAQLHRTQSQMTLGELITAIKELPSDQVIDGFTRPHSYRGYYSDLAFEPSEEKMMAKNLLVMVEPCLGQIFQGYKGGDFTMHKSTPCWISYYGTCGERLMGIQKGKLITSLED